MKIMIAFLVAAAVLASANVAEAKAGGGHAWKGMMAVFQADYDRAHKARPRLTECLSMPRWLRPAGRFAFLMSLSNG